jgi:hypothetical protein
MNDSVAGPISRHAWAPMFEVRRVESAPEQPWHACRDWGEADGAAYNLELFHEICVEVVECDGIYYVIPKDTYE